MKKLKYKILSGSTIGTTEYQIPIFLESSVDEMGIMVGFDGEIEQVEQFCNFTYTAYRNDLTIYNSLNTSKLKTLIYSVFRISWGDGSPDTALSMPTVYSTNLPYVTHTYFSGTYDVEITVDSPWNVQKIKRTFTAPFSDVYGFPNDFGVLTFTIPYSDPSISVDQAYLEDYRGLSGNTNNTPISFLAVGKSRIDEFKVYGLSNQYNSITITSEYTGYTIDNLYYMDYPDGYTHITGNTSSFTHEELYNGMITRNEHLIGFIDEPQIYSDIFVERGRQSIMERNLRLGEIDNLGELENYGSGFFKVKKQ